MCHSAVDDGTDDLFCQEELEDSQSEDSFEVSAAQNANRPRADDLMLIFTSAICHVFIAYVVLSNVHAIVSAAAGHGVTDECEQRRRKQRDG